MTHDIKSDLKEYPLLVSGEQTFIIRRNENFVIGGLVTVREFDAAHNKYTDKTATFKITSIQKGEDHSAVLSPLFVVLSLSRMGNAQPQE
jgi:hypothetical protein